MSASAQTSGTGSRLRTQARKKVNDDATYSGPPSTTGGGAKRHATDKPDGEPRVKRKRVEPSYAVSVTNSRKEVTEAEPALSVVEFNKMSITILYRYLTQFDIVPDVYPSPLSPADPPSPSSLSNQQRHTSRAPSPPALTPANRPRRDAKDQNRRRSSRLLEEEIRIRTPILADVGELHGTIAGIVERHFRELTSINGREEVDTLASFMCAVEKAKGLKNKY